MKTEASCERILLVDDHPLIRSGLRQLLSEHDGFAVCGEAGTLCDARRLYDELGPDLIVLDLAMPDGDGLAFLEETRGWAAPPQVLVLTIQEADGPAAIEAMRIGAAGFLCKRSAPEDVLDAVRRVCSGATYLSGELIERLVRRRN
ncbi:MAG TPA: response regulator transcription factor [Planctomycetaceae bacterium]